MQLIYLNVIFNDTAPTEIYTLSLHDALPISELASLSWRTCRIWVSSRVSCSGGTERSSSSPRLSGGGWRSSRAWVSEARDRKSTRLNSSHSSISYAVFCLKKKKNNTKDQHAL